MQEINDELMMPCAQCCKKHLSAAIARYVTHLTGQDPRFWRVVFARAMINLCEATEGYASHLPFAVGLFVQAEEACPKPEIRRIIREYRLRVADGEWPAVPGEISPNGLDWYCAHTLEAEREYPDIRTAVEREPFYRDNMSEPELKQAEVNYRLAQLRWLDENVFGKTPVEKGEADMATKKAAVKKAGNAKAPVALAKKAACKGGKCKGGCKK